MYADFKPETETAKSTETMKTDIILSGVVGHISLIFELVYPVSLKIVKEQGYVYKMLDFKSDRPDTVEKFAGMRKFVDKFLEGN